ncbi:MAG: SusC/RagA family TonB-linked outer membrane protein, partial [Bacteroidales bacterium]|nr:SusC/RagA family TonB-linked outer membrane protein [Bacteroidales bacterium]
MMKITIPRRFALAFIALFAGLSALAQTSTITGVVRDSAGDPIIGAAVMVKGTTNGVMTNADGTYSIKAKSDAVLLCQLFGYKNAEEPVNGRAKIDFVLADDAEMLEATVVVGYGTLKKTQLVGSVENLDGSKVADRPNANLARSLQGQVAGLNIIQTDGKANHSGNVYIRTNSHKYATRASMTSGSGGTYSLGSGDGSALVLIDGVEGSLGSVNPSDIETVAVLKDASSASIYGSRAYNGVILVTTKEAKGDKFTISYNGSYSYNDRTVKWEDNIVTDGLTWLEAFYDFFQGDSVTPTSAGKMPSQINTWKFNEGYLDTFRQRRIAGNTEVFDDSSGVYQYYGSTNWLPLFYKRGTDNTTHDISVRGSSKKISYSLTGRYYTQSGLYKIGDDDYDQFNIRSKVKLKVTDWLSITNNTSLFRTNQKQSMFTTGSVLGKQIDQHGQPIGIPVNPNGTYSLFAAKTGYASFLEGNTGQTDANTTVVTTTGATVTFLKDVLKFDADFSYKAIRRWRERYRAPLDFYLSDTSVTHYVDQASSYKSRWTYDTDYITANAYLTWTPKLGENHELNVVAGTNIENYDYDRFYLQRKGMIFPDKYESYEMYDALETILIEQNRNSYGNVGFFGRANYTLLKRYILELAARYDGASRFPSSSRWGFFPSASFGWRVSEEPWMQWSRDWLDNFKIRANWGTLGNGTSGVYDFLELISIDKTGVLFDGAKNNYTGAPNVVPESLTWERCTTYDIGIDADFLGNRLSFSGDWFLRDTKDVITNGPQLPAVFGASAPKGNFSRFEDRGWELTLAWKDQFKLGGKDFRYSVQGRLWDTVTTVKEFTTVVENPLGLYAGKQLGEI